MLERRLALSLIGKGKLLEGDENFGHGESLHCMVQAHVSFLRFFVFFQIPTAGVAAGNEVEQRVPSVAIINVLVVAARIC